MRDLTHAGQHPTVLQKSKSKERAKVGCQKKKGWGVGGGGTTSCGSASVQTN